MHFNAKFDFVSFITLHIFCLFIWIYVLCKFSHSFCRFFFVLPPISCPLRWAHSWVPVSLCSTWTVCRMSLPSCAWTSGWAALCTKVNGGGRGWQRHKAAETNLEVGKMLTLGWTAERQLVDTSKTSVDMRTYLTFKSCFLHTCHLSKL